MDQSMKKTILITGATDGIGLATAQLLVEAGHRVLVHGRSAEKTKRVERSLSTNGGSAQSYVADLSHLNEVTRLVNEIRTDHETLDVVINNAGVFKTANTVTDDGLDVRFVVNTLAAIVLTRGLWPVLHSTSRIVNLSSAAQAPVDLEALSGTTRLSDMDAYAQSKLALTIWSRAVGLSSANAGPVVVAVNPGSLLATKMVEEAFGHSRGGVEVGASILYRAALDDEFANASGCYFDNDLGRFADPHPDALDTGKSNAVISVLDELTR